jgi:putative transposase
MIVPGGGLSFDNTRWIASRPNFLVHVNVLARLFRGKMLAMLVHAYDAGQLKFFNAHAGLTDKRTFKRFIGPLRHIKWVVYCKAPFAGPKQVLRYLSRYTHRVAISNRRLMAADDTSIAFRWKNYRKNGPGRWKTMRLHPHEFIRRFLIHVLPKGFHRIRHYGLFASATFAESIATARALLDVIPPAAEAQNPPDVAPDSPRVLPCPCPCCGGRMIVIRCSRAAASRGGGRPRSGSTHHKPEAIGERHGFPSPNAPAPRRRRSLSTQSHPSVHGTRVDAIQTPTKMPATLCRPPMRQT